MAQMKEVYAYKASIRHRCGKNINQMPTSLRMKGVAIRFPVSMLRTQADPGAGGGV